MNQEFESLKPPLSKLMGISLVALLLVSLFSSLDGGRFIFLFSLVIASGIATYQFLYIQRTNDFYKMGGIIFYLLCWFGMFAFLPSREVSYLGISLKIKSIMLLSILPLVLMWVALEKRDPFFGVENQKQRKVSLNWKLVFLTLLIVNFLIIEYRMWPVIELLILVL